MKYILPIGIIVLVGIGAGFFFIQMVRTKNLPITTILQPAQPMKIIGWIPNWDQENAIASYKAHVNNFQYISVFWYRIDATGALTTYQQTVEDPTLIAFVHQHHQKIFALVANLPDFTENKDWDPDRVQKVIGSEQARQKHIADLLSLVQAKGFDGIDIDYEALRPSQRDDFSTFIKELSKAAHNQRKLLGVAIFPPGPRITSGDVTAYQDLPFLSLYADQLYFMTYLEHTLGSDPGPPGSLPWIQESIEYALNVLHIPATKIYMGVGLMGIAWRQNQDGSTQGDMDDIPFTQVLSLSQDNHATSSWDAYSQTPFLTFTDGNGKHIIWFENSKSVGLRVTLAKNLGLGGIAFWRLGGEDQAIWQYVK